MMKSGGLDFRWGRVVTCETKEIAYMMLYKPFEDTVHGVDNKLAHRIPIG